MTPLGLAIVLLIMALMIAAVIVSYRRTRRGIEDFEILEVFQGELTQLKLSLTPWMVPRVEKRLRKLGWGLADSRPAATNCTEALFEKSDDPDAQPLSVVLHQLNRSGFISGRQIDLSNFGKQTEA